MEIKTQYEAATIRLAQGKRVVWLDLDGCDFYYQYDGVIKYKKHLLLKRLYEFCLKHNIDLFRGERLLYDFMITKYSSNIS